MDSLQSRVWNKLLHYFWRAKLYLDRWWPFYPAPLDNASNDSSSPRNRKLLYASPVGREGKRNLANIIRRFGHRHFDYLIFVYDDTTFPEPIFSKCRFIHEKGILCYFFKKYLTPQYCRPYDYVFPWVDDIGIGNFSYTRFLDVFERNKLDVAQPSLSRFSLVSYDMTLSQPGKVGRLTDYVEVMAQVFTRQAWAKYWEILEPDGCYFGWGYAHFLRSLLNLRRLGVLDCEVITHQRKTSWSTDAKGERERIFEKYRQYPKAEIKTLGELE